MIDRKQTLDNLHWGKCELGMDFYGRQHSVFLLFACRFCVGDRFYLCENKILCEYDYEERLAFANMAIQSPASLAYIKRQLPPTPTPPGQNMHPGHNPLQAHQGLGQSVAQHNHVPNVS